MAKNTNCLNFKCLSTKGNLIFIFIFNTLKIAFNSYKIIRNEFQKKIFKGLPILSAIEIALDSISTVNSIIVFIIKKFMEQKMVNKIITISSKILKFALVIFSFIKIFVLMKDFAKFDNNNFLNTSTNNEKNDGKSNQERIDDLKKFKDLSLEIYKDEVRGEEYFFCK